MNNRPSVPVAVERAYDLWLWLDARVTDFPVTARHSLGPRVLGAIVDVMDLLTRAAYTPRDSPRRLEALLEASHRLALLRLLLRGCRERKYLSVSQHEHVVERVSELGRMLGGWIRHTGAKEPTPE